jgi:hypothetical protein
MNPIAEDIKDMLEAQSSLALTFGTDLFIAIEPTGPDACVTILDTPSFPPDLTLDPEERFYNSSFQIRVRHTDYLIGMALARNIMESLHGRAHETWNGTLYTVITATGEPAPMSRDENNRFVIITNFNSKRR